MADSLSNIVVRSDSPSQPYVMEPTPSGNGLMNVIRWRWRLMLVVTVAAMAVSLTGVFLAIKPKYEVAATVHVAQVVKPVLFSDPDTDISRQYNVYIATQAQGVASPIVIQSALNTSELRGLPSITAAEDPIGMIASRLLVEQVRGTELLKVSMTGSAPNELATIINQVLKTYIRLQDDRQREWAEKILGSLRSEQAELAAKLETKGIELRQLAVELGPNSPDIPDANSGTLTTELQRLIMQATKESELAQSRMDALVAANPTAEQAAFSETEFQQFLHLDPQWSNLSQQLAALPLAALSDTQAAFGPEHPSNAVRSKREPVIKAAMQARESELQDLFKRTTRVRLENAKHEADITLKVLKSEWDRLNLAKKETAKQAVVLEDVRHERERLEQALSQVRQKIWNVQVEQNRMSRISIDSPAVAPTAPNINQRLKYSFAAIVGSLILGGFSALVRHRFDNSVRTPAQVIDQLGFPLLGSVQFVQTINGTPLARDQRFLEPIRTISATLLAGSHDRKSRYKLISSPTEGSGKSLLATNLARSLAATGRRVLLVDADNMGQGASRETSLTGKKGLKELLEGTARTDDVIYPGDVENMSVLPAGKRSDRFPEYLAARKSTSALRSLFDSYDEVVVDSPPVLAGSTTILLASIVDEIVLVLRAGISTTEQVEAVRQQLAPVSHKLVGVILNAVDPRRLPYGSYYAATHPGEESHQSLA